jgi:hypothetical protein
MHRCVSGSRTEQLIEMSKRAAGQACSGSLNRASIGVVELGIEFEDFVCELLKARQIEWQRLLDNRLRPGDPVERFFDP